MRIAILAMMAAAVCGGQTTVNGGRDYKGSLKASGGASTVDFGGAGSTAPVKTGTTAARPASCSVGQIYFATDATVGQNLAFCTSSGVWSQMTGGGGGGGGGTPISHCAPAGASATTYTCSPSPAVSSYAAGVTLAFVPDVNGAGGATTVNVSGLGAKSVKQADGSTNPGSTDLVAGKVYVVAYDGTVFRLGLNATNAANITNGTLASARLPLPAASTVGGVQSKAAASHQFLTSINTDGTVSAGQPAGTDLSDTTCAVTVGATPAMNATNCNGTGGSYNAFKLGPLAQNASPTFSNGLAGRTYVIQVYQGAGTAFTVTWPGTVTGGCPVSTTLSSRTQLVGVVDSTGTSLLVQSCTYLDDASTIIQGPTRAAPATPASGSVSCWFDSTANTELCKDSSGNVSAAVRTSSATSNQWVQYIDSAGVQQKSQPNFTNLAGVLALGHTPLTTRGDLLVANSTPGLARLGVGAADTVLMGGTDPAYVSLTNCGDATHAVSYNTTTHAWGCQNITASAGSVTLDAVTAAGSANAINSADNAQTWKWTLTTASKTGFRLSENTASAATGTPILIGIDTLATSTVNPFQVTAGGTANGVRVDTTGKLSKVGTGQVNADHFNGNVAVAVADGGTGISTAWARTYQFFAAGCNNATAFAGFDLPTSSAPAASCLTGSNTQQGTLDFDDASNETAQFNFILPAGWTGNIDADLYWLVTTGGGSNAAKWTVATSCEATGASYNGAFNTAQTITTNVGCNNNLTQSTQSAVTTTGCSAGSEMHVKIGRDTTDTSTATIRLKTVVLTLRITPQA